MTGTVVARYLADISALTAMKDSAVAARLGPLIEAGKVATCAATRLQLVAAVGDILLVPTVVAIHEAAFTLVDTTESDFVRAGHVQRELAAQGYRMVSWTPLVVAAVAERHAVTVLHRDESFDLIAKITGQAMEWTVSLPTADRSPSHPGWGTAGRPPADEPGKPGRAR